MPENVRITDNMQDNPQESGYGKTLHKARQALGLSVESVAASLHLESSVVEAIEREDNEKLPAAAFARGYIRSYSLLVGCNADELVKQFNQSSDEKEYELPHVSSLKPHKRSPLFIGISIIVVGGLLGLLLVWGYDLIAEFRGNDVASTTQQHTAPASISPAEEEIFAAETNVEQTLATIADPLSVPATAGQEAESAAEQMDADSVRTEAGLTLDESPDKLSVATGLAENVATQDSSFSAEIAEENEIPLIQELTPLAPTGTDRILLTFSGESWVEVTDANGYQLVFGLYNENVSPISLQGQAPFKLMLGNANSVDVSINESLFNVQPYIRSNNTARFLVESPGAVTNN